MGRERCARVHKRKRNNNANVYDDAHAFDYANAIHNAHVYASYNAYTYAIYAIDNYDFYVLDNF